jgi:hypothetical protein
MLRYPLTRAKVAEIRATLDARGDGTA